MKDAGALPLHPARSLWPLDPHDLAEHAGNAGRDALLSRWLHLTRTVLPAMAAAERWPIRLDHCFMRVCLDSALGRPWHETVRRPAIRHLTDAQLARAIAIAELVRDQPAQLPALNDASLRARGHGRRASPERTGARATSSSATASDAGSTTNRITTLKPQSLSSKR